MCARERRQRASEYPAHVNFVRLRPYSHANLPKVSTWLPNLSHSTIQSREPHVSQTATAPSYDASLDGHATLTNEEAARSLIQRGFNSDLKRRQRRPVHQHGRRLAHLTAANICNFNIVLLTLQDFNKHSRPLGRHPPPLHVAATNLITTAASNMEVPIPPTSPQHQPAGTLAGLAPMITPSNARETIKAGLVTGFSFGHIKQSLRTTAISVFTHQKLAPRYQYRVRDGANNLVFFLCAVQAYQAPGNDDQLPRIGEVQMLPLGNWESLYLALVAEIRAVYSDIKLHFNTEREGGARVLHMRGGDGKEEQKPFTALNFGHQLEEMWHLLMDARLLGPLEEAVRMENATEPYRAKFGTSTFRQRFQDHFHRLAKKDMDAKLDATEGIINQDYYTSDEIIDQLWHKHATLVSRACREHLHIEVDLRARRSQLREVANSPPQAAANQDEPFCLCQDGCRCRPACQFEIGICACKDLRKQAAAVQNISKTRNDSLNQEAWPLVQPQSPPAEMPAEVPDKLAANEPGSISDDMARMQMAGSPEPDQRLIQSYKTASQAARTASRQTFSNRRGRAGTEDGDLANVPSVHSTRARETIRLGLYGGDSVQRYPDFRSMATPAPESGSNYTTNPPARRPVPVTSAPVSSPPQRPQATQRSETTSPDYALTITSSSSPEPEAPSSSRPSNRFLPQFLRPKPKGTTGQSSTGPAQDNTRQSDNEFDKWDTSHVKTPKISTQECRTKAGERYHSPMGRHSADSPVLPDRKPPPATIPRSNTADSTQLPVPDFIAPRPALKQRYVSAGGTAKLADREEIEGFKLPEAADPGVYMKKDELMKRLADGEFGTPPRSSTNTDSVPRSSYDTAVVSSNSSARVSDDVGNEQEGGGKRDRTTSNTSSRGLRRLFSRNDSITETAAQQRADQSIEHEHRTTTEHDETNRFETRSILDLKLLDAGLGRCSHAVVL
ncbi:hypothetical protein M409DRAFT_49813 [Zasmidium cellare ATCC 36951]|uniref:Uncharacterized protein n=1 Tax=Zasmidium cellare ATCC 36951 TaxID=1080233 RepID=A0A6A6D321_ZASCE|nr:uncharacterized protein M409DRAFT_49813 [Zasmidium cellare ATCC 36951]KAF2172056.1 hypothetical protein M409DRAFT_49813 [Zasmidium cellare ATCC 36951]